MGYYNRLKSYFTRKNTNIGNNITRRNQIASKTRNRNTRQKHARIGNLLTATTGNNRGNISAIRNARINNEYEAKIKEILQPIDSKPTKDGLLVTTTALGALSVVAAGDSTEAKSMIDNLINDLRKSKNNEERKKVVNDAMKSLKEILKPYETTAGKYAWKAGEDVVFAGKVLKKITFSIFYALYKILAYMGVYILIFFGL